MNREKLIQAIGDALQLVRGSGGAEERLGSAQRTIERVLGLAGGMLEDDRPPGSIARGSSCRMPPPPWSAPARSWNSTPVASEQVEERLFALRAAARKHQVTVDDLPRLRDEMAGRLARIDAGAERLTAATDAARAARAAFASVRSRPVQGTSGGGEALGRAVLTELAPLKLDKARFAVDLDAAPGGRLVRRRAPSGSATRSRPIPVRNRDRSPRSPRAASSPG